MPKIEKILDWRHWWRGLWTAAVVGGCNAVLASLGLAAGFVFGADVQPLELKQAGGIFISAAIIKLADFLREKPTPDEIEVTVDSNPPHPGV